MVETKEKEKLSVLSLFLIIEQSDGSSICDNEVGSSSSSSSSSKHL